MYRERALQIIGDAGASGVNQTELFVDFPSGNGAANMTNTLAQLRASGEIVLRREIRENVRVGVYYLPENAPQS